MYSFIRGILKEKHPTHIVLDTNGIGYEILIPLSTYERLPEYDQSITILTHLHVREDILQLFGFASKEERELFQMLLSVSGIGPKAALGILSGMSIHDFKRSIVREDIHVLSTLPGIGKKTAARLVLELKEKISEYESSLPPEKMDRNEQQFKDALLALISLGYNKSVAYQAIKKGLKEVEKIDSVEALVRSALGHIK
ncbi:Holliday junction branch migration protein RuvA [Chlamydiota bacterium]